MITRRTALLLPLAAAGCGGDVQQPETYRPPSYAYLTPLRLNVAVVQVDDRTSPAPANAVEAAAPLRPAEALRQMARDRLVAAGSTGRAVMVLDRASLVRLADGIEGFLAVHLDVFAGGDARVGFAEAQVTRRQLGDGAEGRSPAALNRLVTQMMDDMNIEIEFQIRRSLREYLQVTDGTAAQPAPVASQDLSPPTGSLQRPIAPPSNRVGSSLGPSSGPGLGPGLGQVLTRP